MIKAHWHHCDNFGDKLTPYLIKKLSGQEAIYTEQSIKDITFLVTGSLLGSRIGNSVIWGTGTVWKDDLLYSVIKPTNNHKVIATRGPISQEMIIRKGGPKSKLYGDPGLILPRIYNPSVKKKFKLGMVPSTIDYHLASKFSDQCLVIDVMQPTETVIDNILSCESILASALHGLIAAVAYGIPAYWVKYSDNIVGDGTKYHDFLLSLGIDIYEPVDFRKSKLEDIKLLPFVHKIGLNVDDLLESCPFRI